ncbi:hypothetical protein FG386_000626 [Cryptosporidium ryanae]|uniref:uncharacterized protein n=1 Tax=Cryptosporidium ryanae TaxID=515981 RepID=UPI00351A056A|nr:hypothetical protein FG386_000626 [Cryptosporidium ryanae]
MSSYIDDKLTELSSNITNDDMFNIEEEIDYSRIVNDGNNMSDVRRSPEKKEENNELLNDEEIDLILEYVSVKASESSEVTGNEVIDSTIQNCRSSGFDLSEVLDYLIGSGHVSFENESESNEDSLSYIQSVLKQKNRYIPSNIEEIALVVSSVSKLFVLELMAKVNKQMNRDKRNNGSNTNVINVHSIYNAFSSQKDLIPSV